MIICIHINQITLAVRRFLQMCITICHLGFCISSGFQNGHKFYLHSVKYCVDRSLELQSTVQNPETVVRPSKSLLSSQKAKQNCWYITSITPVSTDWSADEVFSRPNQYLHKTVTICQFLHWVLSKVSKHMLIILTSFNTSSLTTHVIDTSRKLIRSHHHHH